MRKPQRVRLTLAGKTVADVTSVGECQAWIGRITRSIKELEAEGAAAPSAPDRLKMALHFKRRAYDQLQVRLRQLVEQTPRSIS